VKNVRFDPRAKHELARAVSYYDDKSPGQEKQTETRY